MKRIRHNKFDKYQSIIGLLVILTFLFMTVGFALYDEILSLRGNITVLKYGRVEISNINISDTQNAVSNATPSINNEEMTYDVTFSGGSVSNPEYKIEYLVEIQNNSEYDEVYDDYTFNPTVVTSSGNGSGVANVTVSGISNGDIIASGDTKNVIVTINLLPDDYASTYELDGIIKFNFTKETTGNLLATLPNNATGNLRSPNTSAPFTITVINTYNYSRTFTLELNNDSNFKLVNSSGNALGSFRADANSTQEFTFYVKEQTNSILPNDTETIGLVLKSNSIPNINVGNMTLLVDINYIPDTTAPQIGNITSTIQNTINTALLSWSGMDESTIDHYTILVYTVSGSTETLSNTIQTTSDETSYTITNLQENTNYVYKVYGTDSSNNTATQTEINNCSTSTTTCRKSSTYTYKWTFTVTYSLTNGLSTPSNTTAYLGSTYSSTLKTSSTLYTLPTSLTSVTMNGVTLSSGSGYTYESSSGLITIPNVTGNITITARGSGGGICLVKGTKILLANNKTKNIEDINYDDLLKVWSYEQGRFINTYPIWIEKEGVTSSYQLTTFSDGTTLKTVGFHGIYSSDQNLFVSVDDKENFKVGTNVLIQDSDSFKKVKVKSIKYINEKVKYYHVVSTRYYNIIANNLLTTDGTVILSNLYGFNNNITWKNKNNNEHYSYDELKSVLPYYMFLGLRASEGKYLEKYMSLEEFKYYLSNNQTNPNMLLTPKTNINGKRLWMVTTSNDIVNEFNKDSYLIEEGSYYILPKTNNIIKWYNTSDNKYYYPGDKVQIWHGTYFEGIKK